MLVFFTDTDCDITPAIAKEYGFELITMPYYVDGKENMPYVDWDVFDYKKFYNMLRDGVLPKTTAISPVQYTEYFEPHFKAGNDIMYVHFSKSMSGTFDALKIAVDELLKKYPERKFYTIDTKAITALSYLIIKQMGTLYKQGATAEELLSWAESEVQKYAIYFYVDDLTFFRQSGRVSGLTGVMGNLLGIHPIIHINSDGVMTNIAKARGKICTMKKVIEMVDEIQEDISSYPVVIAHTDAEDLALELGKMLKEKYGEELNIEYLVVNPTIGSHCGPNSVGVAFHAKHR
ncbi:MAG: DegV family protein [Candidatus Coproplasma sp.]